VKETFDRRAPFAASFLAVVMTYRVYEVGSDHANYWRYGGSSGFSLRTCIKKRVFNNTKKWKAARAEAPRARPSYYCTPRVPFRGTRSTDGSVRVSRSRRAITRSGVFPRPRSSELEFGVVVVIESVVTAASSDTAAAATVPAA
jgi:hypothetical protein